MSTMSSEDVLIAPVVHVMAREPARGGTLENPVLRTLGGRQFIVGTLAPWDGSDPREGLTFWFALDEVVMLTEFPDLETAHAAFSKYRERKQGKNGKQKHRWPSK